MSEIKIGVIGDDAKARKRLIDILVNIHGTNVELIDVDSFEKLGGVISQVENMRKETFSKFDIKPKLCDCLNCRLGKHETCQTFSPSKKGKRK